MEIDTMNKFMVGAGGRGKGFMMLNPPLRGQTISADDALLLAATLVAIAEHEASHSFAEVLQAVEGA